MSDLEGDIRRTRAGDLDGYGHVVQRFDAMVRAVIASLVPDRNSLDDLVQETFLIAYRRIGTYRPGTRFDAWLRTIARNVSRNARRSWFRKTTLESRWQAELEQEIEQQVLRAAEALPEETAQVVRECVGDLDPRNRTLIEGFYMKGLSIRELAAKLELSEGAAKVALFRSRQALAGRLRKRGVLP